MLICRKQSMADIEQKNNTHTHTYMEVYRKPSLYSPYTSSIVSETKIIYKIIFDISPGIQKVNMTNAFQEEKENIP